MEAHFHKKLILTDSSSTVVTKDTKQLKSLGSNLLVNQKILTESCEELLLSK